MQDEVLAVSISNGTGLNILASHPLSPHRIVAPCVSKLVVGGHEYMRHTTLDTECPVAEFVEIFRGVGSKVVKSGICFLKWEHNGLAQTSRR